MEPAAPPPARHGLRRPRNLILLALAVVLVAFRIALPYIVRQQAVSQADAALVGRIELDDVDLSLLRAGITLHGLRVFADELPTSPTPGTEPAPAPGEAPKPLASVGRLWVRVGWLPLLRKTLEVAELEVADFEVHLDRARDGALVLPKPVPSPAPAAAPVEKKEGSGWAVLVSAVHLQNGQLGFRDFAVSETPKPFEVRIEDVKAEQLAIVITTEGLGPGHLQLAADVEGGKVAVDSAITMLAKGPKASTKLDVTGLRIDGSRVYLSQLGWSDLTGFLDVALQHEFEMDGPHTVSGTVALRDVAVSVPDLDRKAASFSRLDVALGGVDLVKRHADVSSVVLDGLHLVVRPTAEKPLPLTQALISAAVDQGDASAPKAPASVPGGDAKAPPQPAPIPAAPAAPEAAAEKTAAAPFTWAVADITLHQAVVEQLHGDQVTDLGVEAKLENLSSDPVPKRALDVVVTAPVGSVKVHGDFTQQPPAFLGTLQVEGLGLPELAAPLDVPAARLVRGGVLDLDWKVAAGPPAGGPGGTDARAVRISGPLKLTGLDLQDPEAQDPVFAVGWKELAVEIGEVFAMGIVPSGEPAPPAPAARPATVRGAKPPPAPPPPHVVLDKLTLAQPVIRLARDENGLVLPPALGGPAAKPAAAPASGAAATAPAAAPASPTPPSDAAPAPAGPAPVDLTVKSLALQKARITVEDRTVKPHYRSEIDPLDVAATNVRYPGPTIEKLQLDARTKDGATLAVRGAIAKDAIQIDTKLEGLPLSPFNPYAAGSGYGVGGGSASLDSKFRLQGGKYDAQNKLLVKQLDVTGDQGEALFQQQFGVPLSLAIALLKDLEGNIALDIPVEGDQSGMHFALASIVGQALAKAILGAVTSPLKMISSVAEMGGKIQNVAPQAVAFRPGRTELAEGERERVDALAALLGRSPGLKIHLRGTAGAEDERWLREQSLRAELAGEGVLGAVRHVGERSERRTALEVLEKRAKDEPATVPDDILEWFEQHVAEQNVPPDALERLARERGVKLQTLLAQDHGVAIERIPLDPAEASSSATLAPSVALGLGAVARPVAAPPPSNGASEATAKPPPTPAPAKP